jgi:hypothetical protein
LPSTVVNNALAGTACRSGRPAAGLVDPRYGAEAVRLRLPLEVQRRERIAGEEFGLGGHGGHYATGTQPRQAVSFFDAKTQSHGENQYPLRLRLCVKS